MYYSYTLTLRCSRTICCLSSPFTCSVFMLLSCTQWTMLFFPPLPLLAAVLSHILALNLISSLFITMVELASIWRNSFDQAWLIIPTRIFNHSSVQRLYCPHSTQINIIHWNRWQLIQRLWEDMIFFLFVQQYQIHAHLHFCT